MNIILYSINNCTNDTIQSTKKIFCNENEIINNNKNNNLDNIINQIRNKTRELVGTAVMQNVEDVNKMNFDVLFRKKFE